MIFYRAVTWPILKWKTRWNARQDALRDIPDPSQGPAYLDYLATWVQSRASRLAAEWARRDQYLTDSYAQVGMRYAFAREELRRKEDLEAEALKRRTEWSAQPTRKAHARAKRETGRAARAAQAAELRLNQAIARRQQAWQLIRSGLHVFLADYKRLAHLYAMVNLRYRETNRKPPVLAADRTPPVEIPDSLRTLEWYYPLEDARAGRPPGRPQSSGLSGGVSL